MAVTGPSFHRFLRSGAGPWTIVAVTALLTIAGMLTALIVLTPSSSTSSPPSIPGGSVSYALLGRAGVGSGATGILYDAAHNELFVANSLAGTVSVLNATTLAPVATIVTTLASRSLALDTENGRIFVANDFGSNVSVIDSSTNSLLTTLADLGCSSNSTICANTVGVEYLGSINELFVLENTAGALVRVNPGSYAVIGIDPIDLDSGGAEGFAYVPGSHTIYMPSRGTNSIELVGALNGTTFGRIFLTGQSGPTTSFYDPSNGLVYVFRGGLPNSPANQTEIVNPRSNQVIEDFTVSSHPNGYGYDPIRHLIYVACSDSHNVSVIDDVTNSVVATIDVGNDSVPSYVAVDPVSGHVFIDAHSTGMVLEYGLVEPPAKAFSSLSAMANGRTVGSARWVA